ncbi:ATP-binding cassette domain-containing protein [Nocardioides sp. YIM 152588]|uniref:ABC transporter ATP-binding protein n=1 Tax=Nocardioides sp. YIM 152588 TaxID=3158259 RepID=UPI0032E4E2D7
MSGTPGELAVRVAVPGRLDLAFDVPRGAVIAVVGPNGAGKSTLVQALAGLQPATGSALIDGTDLLALPPQRRRVGLVFQDRRLFPHLSARENVAFGPRSRGVPRAEARAAAQDWLDRLGVGDLAERRPGELSGGQAQRVAIARALACEPELLLLDEPFVGLDVGVAAALRIELAQHLADFGGTTFLVTHDALDALTLADHVLVLDHGRLEQAGPPAEVAARPLTEHAARMVGLNVIRERTRIRAFPPSAVSVSLHQPEGSARHRWQGVVRSAAPHGDAIRLRIDLPGGPQTGPQTGRPAVGERSLIADVTPSATRDLALSPGRPVWAAVKETAITSYDVPAGAG